MPREISAPELAAKLRSGSPPLLVDIREPWEREIARLPGDRHVPLDELPRRAAELKPPEGASLVLYCHAGVRSWMAAEYLEHQEGLKDVVSLGGGIDAWSCLVDPAVPRY
ncbi:MAG TPA: rhodanese-like domain-containing protein [Planctomycetota bacterium]|nr:rhodanese-like domain-containing protein [Planctomycetota bacterium]